MSLPPAAHVPTLTEVIELLAPMPSQLPPEAPPPDRLDAPLADQIPIVTPGLSEPESSSGWTPMDTVVLPAEAPPDLRPERLPVLNAVVTELPVLSSSAEVPQAPSVPQVPPVPALPEVSEDQLAQRVLGVVQKQIDGLLDFRLREAMAPVLARHSEALMQDLREELRRTMCDVVNRAVAQEMAKLRQR